MSRTSSGTLWWYWNQLLEQHVSRVGNRLVPTSLHHRHWRSAFTIRFLSLWEISALGWSLTVGPFYFFTLCLSDLGAATAVTQGELQQQIYDDAQVKFGVLLWSPQYRRDTDLLELVQRRAKTMTDRTALCVDRGRAGTVQPGEERAVERAESGPSTSQGAGRKMVSNWKRGDLDWT